MSGEIETRAETAEIAVPDATAPIASLATRLAEWEETQAVPFRALAAEAKAITIARHIDGEAAGYAEADAMRLRLKNARLTLEGKASILSPLKSGLKAILGKIGDSEVRLVGLIAPEEERLADEVREYNDRQLSRRKHEADDAGVSPDVKILRDGAESTWSKHLAKLIEDKRVADETAALELARNDLRDARLAQARELGASLDDIGDIYAVPDIPEDEWAAKIEEWKTAKDAREAQAAADKAERERLEQETRERVAEQERQREQIKAQKDALRRSREQTLDAIWPEWRANDLGFRLEDASEESMAAYIETVKDARDAERIRDIRAARAEILDDIDRDHRTISDELGTIADDEFSKIKQGVTDAKRQKDAEKEKVRMDAEAKEQARRDAERPARIRAAEYADTITAFVRSLKIPDDIPEYLAAQLARMRENILGTASATSTEIKENV